MNTSDPRRCRVHDEVLRAEDVPIRYGLVRLQEGYLKAQKKMFPNSHAFVLGGCLADPALPSVRRVTFCAECREAERKWEQAHANVPA